MAMVPIGAFAIGPSDVFILSVGVPFLLIITHHEGNSGKIIDRGEWEKLGVKFWRRGATDTEGPFRDVSSIIYIDIHARGMVALIRTCIRVVL
jgi:hypothetical protein